MRVLSPLDLRRSLGAILDAASTGERFLIERDRRPLAMLVSIEDGRRLEPDAEAARARRLAALERLEALGRRIAPSSPPAGARDVPPLESAVTPPGPAGPSERAVPLPGSAASQPPRAPARRAATGPGSPIDRYEAERRRHAVEGGIVPGG